MKKVLRLAVAWLFVGVFSASISACGAMEKEKYSGISRDTESSVLEESAVEEDGLAYVCSADNSYYTVAGIGTCADVDIVIPSAYKGLPVKKIEKKAFANCVTLKSVVIGDEVTVVLDSAFANCSGLTSVTIGDSVTTIRDNAFANCVRLTSVEIAEGLKIIGESSFAGCGITRIVLPASITTIVDYAFFGCSGLTEIEFKGSVEAWLEMPKGIGWRNNVPATKVVCSDGEVAI